MGINRYTRPVQSQYIPTQPNPQMQMMMMQKRANDEARGRQETAIFENELLNTKAYDKKDATRLKELSANYQKQLSDLHDKYPNDPNAMLQEMSVLRRKLDKDRLAGDLYEINKNYQIGMDTQTDAMDRFAKGELTEDLYNYQMADPISGRKAPATSNPLLKYQEKIASKEYSDSVFSNPSGALENALNVARSLAGDEYFKYMTPEAQKVFDAKATVIFKDKYRNADIENNDFGANGQDRYVRGNPSVDPSYNGRIDLEGLTIGDDGSLKVPEIAKFDIQNASAIELAAAQQGLDPADPSGSQAAFIARVKKEKAKIEKAKTDLNLPTNWTDVDIAENINKYYDENAGTYSRTFSPRASNKIESNIPKLYDSKTSTSMVTQNAKVTIDGVEIEANTLDKELASKMKYDLSDKADRASFNKTKESAQSSINWDGATPGEISYTLIDSDGSTFEIGVQNPDSELQEIFRPSHTLISGINEGTLSGIIRGVNVGVKYTDGKEDNVSQSVDVVTEWDGTKGKLVQKIYLADGEGNRLKNNGKDIPTTIDALMKMEENEAYSYLVKKKK